MTIFHKCSFEFVHENETTRLSGGTNFPETALPDMQEHARKLHRQGKTGIVHLVCGNPPKAVGCVVVSDFGIPCGWNEDDLETGWLFIKPD
jgi:hypothetical protein